MRAKIEQILRDSILSESKVKELGITVQQANDYAVDVADEILDVIEESEEQQRRDEKNGLYPEKEDIAN